MIYYVCKNYMRPIYEHGTATDAEMTPYMSVILTGRVEKTGLNEGDRQFRTG